MNQPASPPSPADSDAPDRAVLVTGGGRRVGAAISAALGAAGWFVHIHYRLSGLDAEAVAADIRARGGRAATIAADFERFDGAAAARLVADCAERGPPLTALINNASLFEYDTASKLDEDRWHRHLQTNLTAPVLLARAFAANLSALPEGESACIVNLLDNKVFATNPDYFSYTISKQALEGATRTLALALAPRIRVCGVAPGIALISGKQTEAEFARTHRNNPLRHGCTPDDIARAVRFLLDTPSITGHTIVIDGGQFLARLPRDVAFL
ncbi:MAG: SDR family oxidoreductase [Rhodospirillaceae bacterium]|nr:SDR family oxidoreductase [Rhodospirillaceae bacterium]